MRLRAFAIAASLAAVTVPVSAEVYTINTSGTVISGSDFLGTFGGGGSGALTGDAFTVSFTFDTSLGTSFISPTTSLLQGGSATGFSPIGSAAVTINGTTAVIPATFNGLDQRGLLTLSLLAQEYDGVSVQSFAQIGLNAEVPGEFPLNFTTPFTVSSNNAPNNQDGVVSFLNGQVEASLNVTQISVGDGVVTPVPELSTWAMMILGFVGLGIAGYRKRRVAAT